MGSYNIEGTINHNKRLNFTATMTSDTNFQFEEDLTISDNIDKMFKTDSENPDFPIEIIRKRNLNQQIMRQNLQLYLNFKLTPSTLFLY